MASKTNLQYHVVWTTKYRYNVLTKDHADYLQGYFLKNQDRWKYSVISLAIETDHIHLMLKTKEKLDWLVGKLKGGSSFGLRKKFGKLRRYKHVWTNSHFAASLGSVSIETVKQYVQSQGIETDKQSRTFVYKVRGSKKKFAILDQYLDGIKAKNKQLCPAAMLQRLDGLPDDSVKLRGDLIKVVATPSGMSVKVPGSRMAKIKPFWLSTIGRPLPLDCDVSDSYVLKKGDSWYVYLVVGQMIETKPITPKDVIALDLGVCNPVTSVTIQNSRLRDVSFWGKRLKCQIYRRDKRYSLIQSASKKYGFEFNGECLRKYNNRIKDLLHKMTTEYVRLAKQLGIGIIAGDMRGINKLWRCGGKNNKAIRRTNNLMPYGKILTMLHYKCMLAQVPFAYVDESYTSQTCYKCGHCVKGNRKQRWFHCQSCDFQCHADVNGARNIATKAISLIKAVGLVSANRLSIMTMLFKEPQVSL